MGALGDAERGEPFSRFPCRRRARAGSIWSSNPTTYRSRYQRNIDPSAPAPRRINNFDSQPPPTSSPSPSRPRVPERRPAPTPTTRLTAPTAARPMYFFATCHPGLEPAVYAELTSPPLNLLPSDVRLGRAGVHFRASDLHTGLRASLWLRSAIRVLSRLWQGELDLSRPIGDEIYDVARTRVDWPGLIDDQIVAEPTLKVSASVHDCGPLTSSRLLVSRVRDAACDAFRDATGVRPAPPLRGEPVTLPIVAVANQGLLTLYRDCCGQSLHRRGYRDVMHRASLNEAAAAGCLILAGWPALLGLTRGGDGGLPPEAGKAGVGVEDGSSLATSNLSPLLLDPMCGSGTFLIEAALMAAGVPPQATRPARFWPFLGWSDLVRSDWKDELESAAAYSESTSRSSREKGVAILGNDLHAGALGLAKRDLETAGVKDWVMLLQGRAVDIVNVPRPPSLVVTNPPWGRRLHGGLGPGGIELGAGAIVRPSPSPSRSFLEDGDVTVAGGERVWTEDAETSHVAMGLDRYDHNHDHDHDRDVDDDDEAEWDGKALERAWRELGTMLKRECPVSDVYVLSGNKEVTQFMRMRASSRTPLTIGDVDCRMLHYKVGRRHVASEGTGPESTTTT